MSSNPISSDVDFERDGVQHGHLKLPYSRDDSAWGSILIPICVVRNGNGPTALMTGGNHGDEYEGPIALLDLARNLQPESIAGRVIILPMLNYPAVRAGRRTSPIDRGNLNRLFPGRADGSVTEKIADYIAQRLLPLADVVLDIHSGGRTLEFLPFAACHQLPDQAELEGRCTAAMTAFGAPYAVKLLEIDSRGMLDTVVEEAGKTFVTTELGGGGTATHSTLSIAKRGIRNVLHHAGILPGAGDPAPSQMLAVPDERCYVTARHSGMVEFTADLGDSVKKGDLLARIYDLDATGRPPADYRAACDGLLTGRHFPGLVQTGDTLALLAVPLDR